MIRLDRRLQPGPRQSLDEDRSAVPVHALVRLRVSLPGKLDAGVAVVSPLGVVAYERGTRRWLPVPLAARGARGVLVGLAAGGAARARPGRFEAAASTGGDEMNGPEASTGSPSALASPSDEAMADRELLNAIGKATGGEQIAGALAAATRPGAAVGPATNASGQTVVPLIETVFYGGFGMGMGSGSAPGAEGAPQAGTGSGGGGGGGGGGHSRPVAVVVIGPEGVEVRPVVDVTKLGLAGIGVGLALFAMLRRWRR